MELRAPFGAGRGASLSTGISYAYADGSFRSSRGSQIVYPFNPATAVTEDLIGGIASGRSGKELRETVLDRYRRTMVLDTIGEDLPQRARSVELSPRKDSFGIPLNRINYPADSPYLEASRRYLYRDLPRRMRRHGGRIVRVLPAGEGGHILGTCYMGRAGGVVDPDQRHHRIENLYVAGGSAFPSYSAHHPTLTIAALAIRLGRHLVAHEAPS